MLTATQANSTTEFFSFFLRENEGGQFEIVGENHYAGIEIDPQPALTSTLSSAHPRISVTPPNSVRPPFVPSDMPPVGSERPTVPLPFPPPVQAMSGGLTSQAPFVRGPQLLGSPTYSQQTGCPY